MKHSFALRVLALALAVVGVLTAPGSLSAQDAPPVMEVPAPVLIPRVRRAVDAARFSPATVAAAVDDERPPMRSPAVDPVVEAQRRRAHRAGVRRVVIAAVVLAGVAAAAVGVSKLLPEPRSSNTDDERDGAGLLGLLILLGV